MKSSKISRVVEECNSQDFGSASRYSRPSRIRILRKEEKYDVPASSNNGKWIARVGNIALIVLQMIVACVGYAGFIALPVVWNGIWLWKLHTVG